MVEASGLSRARIADHLAVPPPTRVLGTRRNHDERVIQAQDGAGTRPAYGRPKGLSFTQAAEARIACRRPSSGARVTLWSFGRVDPRSCR